MLNLYSRRDFVGNKSVLVNCGLYVAQDFTVGQERDTEKSKQISFQDT